MLLADLGADVIKVEPSRGDMTRFSGPFTDDDTERAFGGYFASINRNKRSIVLDLKTSSGEEAILRLVDKSDVLVENFAAGVMERLGLSYETLAERNPRLVYAAIRGFGDPRTGASPYADWPAFDVVAQAMGGVVGVTGTEETGGLRCGPSVGDIIPGTLAARRHPLRRPPRPRDRRGPVPRRRHVRRRPQPLRALRLPLLLQRRDPRPDRATRTRSSAPSTSSTPDGQIAIAAPTDKHWRLLCEIIGRPELGQDERYARNEGRQAHAAEIRAIVGEWTRPAHTRRDRRRYSRAASPSGR